MGTGGWVTPRRTEIVYESERTRVTRLFYPDRTLIRKEPLGPDAERRLERETAVLEGLRGVAGLAQLADAPPYPGSVLLIDAGRVDLAGSAKPLAADDLRSLALRLAGALARLHDHEVIHRDVTPANVVLSDDDGEPSLVGFTRATSFGQLGRALAPGGEIAQAMAYRAPELTGRTGRAVDQRADLYGLGATLYELATGRPPFGHGPAARLLHDHLARRPTPPAQVAADVPASLSAIILHLLEKDPDSRYQSAAGVLYDLERLPDPEADLDQQTAGTRVGAHDVPVRLAPSRLVGRDGEVSKLRGSFAAALAGQCCGVLISGAPGVGKTALADELRPDVTGNGGWFVTGKFDLHRRDLEFDATRQAFRALGRLLLAEPEAELAKVRMRILAAVGSNAGLLTAMVPEFAALLRVPPDPGDPLTAQARAERTAARALRAIASKARPVMMFLDDLQWAGTTPLGFVDLMLTEQPTEGLLLVAAYRPGEVDAAPPLATQLARWQGQPAVRHLRLAGLDRPSLAALVADVLRAGRPEAADLADAIEPYAHGNPYETVELLNALRRHGMLTPAPVGWRWQAEAVQARLKRSEAAALQTARLAAMPERTRGVVQAMACLGGRAELRLLRVATGADADDVAADLEPAIEDGLLVLEPGAPGARDAVRFRHDRLREAVLDSVPAGRRGVLQLAMARRLAARPALFAVAAEQYLPVTDAVTDPAERRAVAGLLARAAEQAAMIGDYRPVERLLSAALALTEPDQVAMTVDLRARRHAALFNLGRLADADQDYAVIDALTRTVLDRPEATAVQMTSLTNRGRFAEANDLGIASLRECGIIVPAADVLAAEVGRQLDGMYRWLNRTAAADDAARPEVTDPALVTAGRLLKAMLASTFFVDDPAAFGWVGLLALRIWTEQGAAAPLVAPAINAAFSAIAQRGDYAAAYRVARRVLALSEARGYVPDLSHARHVISLLQPWFEPVENSIPASREARESLLAAGDLPFAGYTYHQTVAGLLDCAPALGACLTQVDEGLSFARRTGSEQPSQWLHCYHWLADALRREGAAGEAVPVDAYERNPLTLIHVYLTGAIAAAIFGDQPALARNSAAARPLLPVTVGFANSAMAHPLRGLSLAWEARAAEGPERTALLAELDDVTRWLAARAADAPDNFLHLLRLVEAERAWTEGDFRRASLAFDAARREVASRQRPWHRALITERAGRFQLAYGLDQAGYELLARARQEYLGWGATAKVGQLDWAYPALRRGDGRPPGEQAADAQPDFAPGVGRATDLLGILSASQALSSQTSVDRLHARVTEVLAAMTGATGVRLVLWDEGRQDWQRAPASERDAVRASAGDSDGTVSDGTVADGAVADGADERGLPMSVLRYLRRTREPLTVADAAADDRFARDPYFAGLGCCSLLAMPILGHGALQAALLLENRLIRGAFTAARLETVELIAGQLAVSLRNAQLYAENRRIADEQAALRRVATLVARGARPSEVFAAVAEETGRLLKADFSVLIRYDPPTGTLEIAGPWLRSGAGPPTAVGGRLPLGGYNVSSLVHETGRPARIDYQDDDISGIGDVAANVWGFRSSVGVPVTIEGRTWGALVVAQSRHEVLPADTEARLAAFNELVGTALANAEASAEVTAARARVVAAADQARRRIERDLHDGAQQRLVSLALQLRQAQAAVPPGLAELSAELDRAVTAANSALDEVGEIARGIHPAILTSGGLRAAVRGLAHRSPIPTRLEQCPDRRLPEHVEVTAYYVIAEALTNATKHAGAAAVSIRAEAADERLVVTIRDDGVGGADPARGTGLAGLRDRVEALGGVMRIESPPGAGTALRVELPLTASGGAAHEDRRAQW